MINVSELTYQKQLELRVALNNAIATHEMEVLNKLNNGEDVTGFRLKKGRKTRKVSNEPTFVSAIEKTFSIPRSALEVTKLAGIPHIEKVLEARVGKDKTAIFMHDHIVVDFGKPSLEFYGAKHD